MFIYAGLVEVPNALHSTDHGMCFSNGLSILSPTIGCSHKKWNSLFPFLLNFWVPLLLNVVKDCTEYLDKSYHFSSINIVVARDSRTSKLVFFLVSFPYVVHPNLEQNLGCMIPFSLMNIYECFLSSPSLLFLVHSLSLVLKVEMGFGVCLSNLKPRFPDVCYLKFVEPSLSGLGFRTCIGQHYV